MFRRIFDFNQNVIGIDPRLPMPLQGNELEWLQTALHEEAEELGDSDELVDQVDALVDSIVFAAGGLYRLGLSVEQAEACVSLVMDANFQKKRGAVASRPFDGVADVTKPEGWVDPKVRIRELLTRG